MTLIGIAPLTMVRTTAGRSEYVYLGAPAPADILPEDRKRLLAEGFLEDVVDTASAVVVVADDPATGTAGPGVTVERPKAVATKQVWVEYRAGQGLMTEDQADDVTLEQLKDDEFMASFVQPAQTPAAGSPAAPAA